MNGFKQNNAILVPILNTIQKDTNQVNCFLATITFLQPQPFGAGSTQSFRISEIHEQVTKQADLKTRQFTRLNRLITKSPPLLQVHIATNLSDTSQLKLELRSYLQNYCVRIRDGLQSDPTKFSKF